MSVCSEEGWQIICPNCEQLVNVNERYCPRCGARCDGAGVEYRFDFEWGYLPEPETAIYGPPWAFRSAPKVHRVRFVCPNCGTKFCTDRKGAGRVSLGCPGCGNWMGEAEYGRTED